MSKERRKIKWGGGRKEWIENKKESKQFLWVKKKKKWRKIFNRNEGNTEKDERFSNKRNRK